MGARLHLWGRLRPGQDIRGGVTALGFSCTAWTALRLLQNRLALGELDALASLGSAGLLPLDLPRVPGQEPVLAELDTIFLVELEQRAGDAEAHGVGLARQAATRHAHD